MEGLQRFADQPGGWSMDHLIDVANELVPSFLPPTPAGKRGQEPVTERLVRFYMASGFVDRGKREGKERRYGYRQLLQLLLLRRMVFEGHGLKAIAPILTAKSNEQLEALLEGGLSLHVESANPALARITERHYQSTSPETPDAGFSFFANAPQGEPTSRPAALEHWTRVAVIPGLELHVRTDFVLTGTPQERDKLVEHLTKAVEKVAARSRRRKSR